uniref:Translation initiation factor IF-1, chloroplastic n=1 Tax=Norrisiella sphaerica TaxID=552664 RepID=A0A7S2QS54_9EUKA|mmetsp:Transcript_1467/g.2010  ORF Transcript_1467/g.2010 Transcript_1467/m.2010 type:complete len:162 (+) Transcript_1467:140-625(+)
MSPLAIIVFCLSYGVLNVPLGASTATLPRAKSLFRSGVDKNIGRVGFFSRLAPQTYRRSITDRSIGPVCAKKKKAPMTNRPQRDAPKVKENDNVITVDGEVVDALPSTMFKVKLDEVEQTVLCQLAGKMRKNNIRVLIGDRVRVELSPYDLSKGRISFRFR